MRNFFNGKSPWIWVILYTPEGLRSDLFEREMVQKAEESVYISAK